MKIIARGNPSELQSFIYDVKRSTRFRLDIERTQKEVYGETITAFVEIDKAKLKPMIRRYVKVDITTLDGKNIVIDLLDGKVMNMENGSILVQGKNFDIFGC